MKRISFFKLFGLVAAALVGLMLGRYSPSANTTSYAMSSEAPDSDSKNSFNNLPCPTEEEYKNLAAKVSLQIPEGPVACDNSHRAQIGKILLLMDHLKINAPADWLPGVQADFKDLLGYVAKNSRLMALDLSMTGAIASNQVASQSIYLGGYFFDNSTLEDISTLIHEARHSVKGAAGHDICVAGDIPLTVGGCDSEFSISAEAAGAYSYELMLQVGLSLYGQDLSQGDREFLMSSALTLLVSRFNVVPESLAQRNDVLLALDKKGTLYAVDIQKNTFTPVPIQLPHKGEKVRRIDFNARDGGAALFGSQNYAYTWTYRRGLRRMLSWMVPEGFKIVDAARIVIPGENGRSRQTIQTPDGIFKYTTLSTKTLQMEFKDVIAPKELRKFPKFTSYFLGGYGDSGYLTADGKVYLLDVMMRETKPFKFPKTIQDPKGWRQGTGGVTYSEMFLLNRAGELKTIQSTYVEIDENRSETTYSLADHHPFKTPSRMIKYFQGLKFHTALTENGRLYVSPYGSADVVELSGPDIIDFTIIQNPVLGKQIVPEQH